MRKNTIIRLSALLGAVAVGFGAFGAHGLEGYVEPEGIATFNTGVRYQFYHALAIAAIAGLYHSKSMNKEPMSAAVWLWFGGTCFFSGSLYFLGTVDWHNWPVAFLGPITPIGGALLIAGWLMFLLATVKTSK